MTLQLKIPGDPVGKGRPRACRRGKHIGVYTPDNTAAWEAKAIVMAQEEWKGRAPLDEPLILRVRAVNKRPKRLYRKKDPPGRLWRTTKPDADNVLKCVADALQAAGVFVDDTRCVEMRGQSLYAAKNEAPCVEVELDRCPEADRSRDPAERAILDLVRLGLNSDAASVRRYARQLANGKRLCSAELRASVRELLGPVSSMEIFREVS